MVDKKKVHEMAKQFVKIAGGSERKKPEPYDTSATVRRVEGNTVYVHISDGVDETPVKKTISAKPGDIVQVRVSGKDAWLVGNASNPPTDDTRANKAYFNSVDAIDQANHAADAAMLADAHAATAEQEAARATTAANIAEGKADDAAAAAGRAEVAAGVAEGKAEDATTYANNALAGLSTLEGVVDTVNWFAAHKKASTDTTVNPNKDYYIYNSVTGTLSKVDPNSEGYMSKNPSQEGWFELTEVISDYVATHVAATNDGLYVVNLANGWKILVSSGGGNYTAGVYIVDPTGGISQATTANGITFDEDKPFYIGDTDAYIVFDGQGHIILGGSGVNIGGNTPLDTLLTELGASLKAVEYGVGSSPSSHSDITSWSSNTPTWTAGSYVWMRTTTNGLNYTYTCIQGAKGATGSEGPVGATGAKGATGDEGPVGATGAKGATGDEGPKGATGDEGPKGATGDEGPKGATGDEGPKGATGDEGPKGATGDEGPKGDTGEEGPKGDTGEQGPKGDTGEEGPKGDTGAKGATGDTGAKGATGDTGKTGATGDTGDQGYSIVASVQRNAFTDAQWGTYGTIGHTENWSNTSSIRNGCRIGDLFLVQGTSTDTGRSHELVYRSTTASGDLYGTCINHTYAERGAKGNTGDSGRVYVGSSNIGATTAAKTATVTDYVLGTTLYFAVTFENANTASAPTLNVNNTGAKPIITNGLNVAYWQAGATVNFYYDGTNYQVASTPVYADTVTIGNPTGKHVFINNSGVQVKNNTNTYGQFDSSGLDVTDGTGHGIAHLGYGNGNPESGTSGEAPAPYYTIGARTGDIGNYSVVEGYDTEASAYASHSEGRHTKATSDAAHSEGYQSLASAYASHAEGVSQATGHYSHAEGGFVTNLGEIERTTASGTSAHAEGDQSNASGSASHAEGLQTTASGNYSHAGGKYTVAGYESQTVIGEYNKNKSANVFEVGNGTGSSSSLRSNAFEVEWGGNVNITGAYKVNGTSLDYVTSKGKTGSWYWAKWASGKIEAWSDAISSGSLTMSQAYRLYRTSNTEFTIASGIFSSTPTNAYVTIPYSANAAVVNALVTCYSSTKLRCQIWKDANDNTTRNAAVNLKFYVVYFPSGY